MYDILSANQAAKVIGCTPQKVRERLKRKIWTFGVYIPKSKTGFKQNNYDISKKELAEFLRISEEELEKRLAEK